MIVSAQDAAGNQNRDDRAYGLMQSALALIPAGEWREAASRLEEAAGLHAEAGRSYDEVRCLQLAATLRRSGGEAGKARALLDRAGAIASTDQPLTVSVSAEEAETAFAEGQYQRAATAWTKALDRAKKSGLKAEGISAMLRRRAAAWMNLAEIDRANGDFDQAFQVLDASGAKETARFVRTDQASLLWRHGCASQAEAVIATLEAEIAPLEVSDALLSEILVLRARFARAKGNLSEALEFSRRSRDAALQAITPVSYFAGSVELAECLQTQENFTDAYGSLATAWATLADLLGNETARSWIEPCLIAYQVRWGEPAFRIAKNEYEEQRRNERKHEA